MSSALSLALQLVDEIEKFPLGECGPSDDSDMQYAYVAGFRDIAKRFVGAVKRIGDSNLSNLVSDLDTSPESIREAHDLRADLYVLIDDLRAAAQDPDYVASAATRSAFIHPDVLLKLKTAKSSRLDPGKLVRMCEELNDAYGRGNYISSALLLRAIINHVPSVFGANRFSEVVAQSGRSIKATLTQLEEARPIADLHTHLLMGKNEHVPTMNQLEPYKPSFEIHSGSVDSADRR